MQKAEIGAKHLVLIDGEGKRGQYQLSGLTDTMKRAVFNWERGNDLYSKGDFVLVEVTDASQNALICQPLQHMGIQEFYDNFNGNRHKLITQEILASLS